MATTLQFRRGTASEAAAFTGAAGELFVDATNFRLYIHDGVTLGGHPVDTTLDGQALSALINSKQDRLVSGTNIKTINGTSLLGSGNIDAQPVLESGTNIKTINGASILGEGNITISSGGGAGASYQVTVNEINGDWHQGAPNMFALEDWGLSDVTVFSQNGANSDITATLPVTRVHGKMFTVKFADRNNAQYNLVINSDANIDNISQTITIQKNGGHATFVWDENWATWWVLTKDLVDAGSAGAVNSVNGQTGDVMVNVLPSSPAELLTGLYAQPLNIVATGINDGGTLKATFTGSVNAQAATDDETLHAFGKSIHNNPNYQLFFGNQPPLTLQWNLPNFELNRTFVCAELNLASEVDNGNGTFTLTPSLVKASIPTDVPGQWMQMDMTQLLAAIEGNDVMGSDGLGGQEVKIVGTPEYASMVLAELTNMQCYSKYTTIMHLVAASLGDFIQ